MEGQNNVVQVLWSLTTKPIFSKILTADFFVKKEISCGVLTLKTNSVGTVLIERESRALVLPSPVHPHLPENL